MSKNIVLLSDGTGNAAARIWRSNVWRLFQSLDLTSSDQVAFYGDGVGTSAFKPLAILGGAFGWGLKRNVLDLYKFLSRNYASGDNIYVFGFSRGAFTVRVLLGIITSQGLIALTSESERHRLAKAAYRAYRRERFHSKLRVEWPFRAIRDAYIAVKDTLLRCKGYDKNDNVKAPSIHFVGVWDTVAAYGLPIEEMTRGVSEWLWPLELPGRKLSPNVRRACHALALDDERTTFHPVLWTEAGEKGLQPRQDGFRYVQDERISQVWFAGVHSNVGGGYPDDSLAHIPLCWMMTEAEHCGLKFKANPKADPDAFRFARSMQDKDGRLYDPRQGMGGYYRYGPRKIEELCNMRFSKVEDDAVSIALPKIHETALQRLSVGAHVYAPIGFPKNYAVVNDQGQILSGAANPFETSARTAQRAATQENIWDNVWKRRVVYFATVGVSLYLALFPLVYQKDRADEFETPIRLVAETIRFIGAFIPNFFDWWLDSYATNPIKFSVTAIVLAALIGTGVKLSGTITDQMRGLWRTAPATALRKPNHGFIFKLRTNTAYRLTIRAFKRHILPGISALAILYFGLAVLSHVLFNVWDSAGYFCRESGAKLLPWKASATVQFKVNELCQPTGIALTEGERYYITIKQTTPWKDGRFDAGVSGFEISQLPNWYDRVMMAGAVPLRRVFLRPWFRPIARIGSKGTDEYFLDPDKPSSLRTAKPDELDVAFRVRRDGELFLYVNDAVIGIPGLASFFISNNQGEAQVTVHHLAR